MKSNWTARRPGRRLAAFPPSEQPPRKAPGEQPVSDPSRKNILITDDEDTLRELISAELRARGYECISLASKKDALAWCAEHHPDLVITDLRSPDMDGFQFLRLLKSNANTKGVPIVVMTGYADENNVKRAQELGAAGFITKPCALAEFQTIIDRVIGKPST